MVVLLLLGRRHISELLSRHLQRLSVIHLVGLSQRFSHTLPKVNWEKGWDVGMSRMERFSVLRRRMHAVMKSWIVDVIGMSE
jgi:hypothetical protein